MNQVKELCARYDQLETTVHNLKALDVETELRIIMLRNFKEGV